MREILTDAAAQRESVSRIGIDLGRVCIISEIVPDPAIEFAHCVEHGASRLETLRSIGCHRRVERDETAREQAMHRRARTGIAHHHRLRRTLFPRDRQALWRDGAWFHFNARIQCHTQRIMRRIDGYMGYPVAEKILRVMALGGLRPNTQRC